MKNLLPVLFTILSITMVNAQNGSFDWIPLAPGLGSNGCMSTSDCDIDRLCFGLQYTPGYTGVVTDYTTGFFVDCVGGIGGTNPIVSNSSCIMNDNSQAISGCATLGLLLVNCSGNSGTTSYDMGVPVIIHQVCFSISSGETSSIEEDLTSNLTASINLVGGGAATDFPSHSTFTVDKDAECPNIGLPVELVSFTAKKDREVNILNWTSASEENTDKFIVQRSADNFDTFEDIASVEAAGFSTERLDYFSIDEKPLATSYYRLKMIDLDGSFEYSEVVVLKRDGRNLSFNSIAPSPTRGEFEVSFESDSSDDITFSITNITGHIVHSQIESPRNNTSLAFNLNDLPDGIYIITMTNGFSTKSEKIILHK